MSEERFQVHKRTSIRIYEPDIWMVGRLLTSIKRFRKTSSFQKITKGGQNTPARATDLGVEV